MQLGRSIPSVFLRGMIILVLASLGLPGLIWVQDEYAAFRRESQELRERYLEDQKALIHDQVAAVASYVEYMRKDTDRRLRVSLQERVNEACAIAASIFRENSNDFSRDKLGGLIKDALRPIRFNEGRGYFFAFNLAGVEQLFPDRPEMEGRDMLPVQGARGEYVVRDMLALVRERGEGFYRYTWTKPGAAGRGFPKLAFVKLFAPLGWVLGAGEYLDDADAQVQAETLRRIVDLRFGREGYFFGSTLDGGSLFSNGKITTAAGSIKDLTDPNGVKIFLKHREAAVRPDGGFVEYVWPRLDFSHPSPKISYVKGVPEWGWIIGAGVYLDTIEQVITAEEARLRTGLWSKLGKSLVVILGLAVLIFFLARYVSERIRAGVSTFSEFFERAARESALISTRDLGFSEFRRLAESANKMVTDRRQAEQALRDSEEHLRSVYNAADNVALVVTDLGREETVILDFSPGAEKIFGYTRDEALGRPVALLHPPGQSATFPDVQAALREGRKGFAGETVLVRKSGETFPALLTIHPKRDAGGGISGTIGVTIDISELRRTERELGETRALLAAVVEQNPMPMAVRGVGGRESGILNAAAKKFLGIGGEPGLGEISRPDLSRKMTILDNQGRPLDRADLPMERALAGLGTAAGEYIIVREDGVRRWATIYGAPIFHESGKILAGFVAFSDITARKAAEEENARLQSQLKQAQKMEAIGVLAGGIAHDFNNILAAIIGYTELALLEVGAKNVGDYLRSALRSAERARDLIRQILTFSRKGNEEQAPIDAAMVINEAVELLSASLPRSIAIRTIAGIDSCTVLANAPQLNRILINLAANAAHAMREKGGVLEIRQDVLIQPPLENRGPDDLEPGVYYHLAAADTGEGMDAKTMERVFDPFFTTKEVGQGTGMGLAVVHGIVMSHGGRIRVDSQPGQGACFHVFLPALDEAAGPSRRAAPGSSLAGTERILLVDDERDLLAAVRENLERLGYRVESFSSPLAALEFFKNNPGSFDLVITDMSMPGISGEKLAARILEIQPGAAIILCTGFSENIDREKAKARGIREFILKPYLISELTKTIREVLAARPARETR
ncbi:MAG: cache domain-containing protein [Pseudomonadota bacterium]